MLTLSDIAHIRFHNQQIAQTKFKKPDQVIAWLGAMQGQEYAMAKWAIAQRMQEITDSEIDQAFANGSILRTHLLRPTWHLVTPADIRWLLALTGPRVQGVNAYMYRKLEMDSTFFKRSNAALIKALQGGKQLTRLEIASSLQQAGIETAGELRMGYILMHAELEGIVCSGARRGKQFTYALLEERAPHVKSLDRDEALVELVRRYFTSRGPATMKDFVVWSGLTMADVKKGIELLRPKLESAIVEDQTYWFAEVPSLPKKPSGTAHLLPIYDEYVMGYKDRSALLGLLEKENLVGSSIAFDNIIVIDSMLVGSWKRTLSKKEVLVEINFNVPLTKAQKQAVNTDVARYGKFLGLSPVIVKTEKPPPRSREGLL
ncbi:MAG TPA: winged helix DNA-binding domain-containing protein [Anaerolineales bacterium]|nr:winged helix DNA-binding domain-containing protein [Anaerolineales bacterium]